MWFQEKKQTEKEEVKSQNVGKVTEQIGQNTTEQTWEKVPEQEEGQNVTKQNGKKDVERADQIVLDSPRVAEKSGKKMKEHSGQKIPDHTGQKDTEKTELKVAESEQKRQSSVNSTSPFADSEPPK